MGADGTMKEGSIHGGNWNAAVVLAWSRVLSMIITG